MIELIVTAFLVGSTYILVKGWRDLHRVQMDRLRFHRDRFFEQAAIAVSDDRVIDETLHQIRLLAEQMDAPEVLGILASAVQEVDKEIRSGAFRARATPDSVSASILWEFFMAVSYTRPIRGVWVRSMMADMANPRSTDVNTRAIAQRVRSFTPQMA